MAVWARNRGTGPLAGSDLVNADEVGAPLGEGRPATFRRAWRGAVLLGRIVDWSDYDAREALFVIERWDGAAYRETGEVATGFDEALEILVGETLEREPWPV